MYSTDLITRLAKLHRRPQKYYREALTELLAGIQQVLAEGKDVQFTGFGTFYTRTHKAGKGVNFKTKQPIKYDAVRQVAFRPGDVLKQAIRRKKKGLFGR